MLSNKVENVFNNIIIERQKKALEIVFYIIRKNLLVIESHKKYYINQFIIIQQNYVL